MTGRWKAGKSRSRIPLSSHRPLEIPQQRRDFHIPTVPAAVLPGLNIKPKKTGCLTAAPNQHERKNRSQNPHSQGPVFRITLYWKRFRVSGSFYDWKMLRYQDAFGSRSTAFQRAVSGYSAARIPTNWRWRSGTNVVAISQG